MRVTLNKRGEGFTLTELMVALVIVAIVSAIAIPLYTEYSMRSYRAEVQSDLLNCSQALERFNARTFTYEGTAVGGADDGDIDPNVCDALSVRQSRYDIEIVATRATYTLTATPVGVMDGDGVFTLNNAGNRTWDENGAGGIEAGEDDWIKGN